MTPQDTNTPKEQQLANLEAGLNQQSKHVIQQPPVLPVRHEADQICQREGCGKRRSEHIENDGKELCPVEQTFELMTFLPPAKPEGKPLISAQDEAWTMGLLIEEVDKLRSRLDTAEQSRNVAKHAMQANIRMREQAQSDLTAAIKRADEAETKLTAARSSNQNQIAALRKGLYELKGAIEHAQSMQFDYSVDKTPELAESVTKSSVRLFNAIDYAGATLRSETVFPVLTADDVRPVVEALEDVLMNLTAPENSARMDFVLKAQSALSTLKAKMGVQG